MKLKTSKCTRAMLWKKANFWANPIELGRRGASDRMCRKFRAGESSLDDAPRSGRPVEVDSYQIEALIEDIQCYTT